MSRIRSVKPEFFTSVSLAQVAIETRFLFIGLWCEADDYGRGIDSPKRIAGVVFPHDDKMTEARVKKMMDDLEEVGCIQRYTAGRGHYFCIPAWEEHQAATFRRGVAKHPAAPKRLQNVGGRVQDVVGRVQNVVGSKEQGTGSKEQGTRNAAAKPRDELFEALCELDKADPSKLTKAERGRLNSACKSLRSVNATPDQVRAVAKAMLAANWSPSMITAKSVESHWSQFVATEVLQSHRVVVPKPERGPDWHEDPKIAKHNRDELAAVLEQVGKRAG